ncbi:hypothetical protein Tco_0812538 [Tanacetum coccineum]
MDEELRESYRTLEKRLFHEGRIVTPSFISENNMLPFFQAVGLEPFLTLNEPICPRFVVEFYHSLEVKRDEELRPYIEFKLGQFTFKLTPSQLNFVGPKHNHVKKVITTPRTTQDQLLRDPNRLYIDDIHLDLKGWELFFKENFFCSIDKRNKVKACTAYMLYYLTIERKFNFTSRNPQAIVLIARFTFHEHVMDPLDTSRNPGKEKGKKFASPSVISSSSS